MAVAWVWQQEEVEAAALSIPEQPMERTPGHQLSIPVFCFPLDPDGVGPARRRDEGDHPWCEPGPGLLGDRPRGAGGRGAVHAAARALHRRRTVSGFIDLYCPPCGSPGLASPHKASSLTPSKPTLTGKNLCHLT